MKTHLNLEPVKRSGEYRVCLRYTQCTWTFRFTWKCSAKIGCALPYKYPNFFFRDVLFYYNTKLYSDKP
jgi:hypothetical protein